eukprot:1637125-Prymnesium_polylepis.2
MYVQVVRPTHTRRQRTVRYSCYAGRTASSAARGRGVRSNVVSANVHKSEYVAAEQKKKALLLSMSMHGSGTGVLLRSVRGERGAARCGAGT